MKAKPYVVSMAHLQSYAAETFEVFPKQIWPFFLADF